MDITFSDVGVTSKESNIRYRYLIMRDQLRKDYLFLIILDCFEPFLDDMLST